VPAHVHFDCCTYCALYVFARYLPVLSDYRLAAGSLYAIYPPGRHLSHRVRVLIDFLAERFALAKPT